MLVEVVSRSYLQEGDTAVILAVASYYQSILKELVRVGADLNLQNQVTSPLNTATDESLSYLFH